MVEVDDCVSPNATFQDMRPYSKTIFLGEMALEEQPGYRFP